jgi:hypothetical protein
MVNTGEFIGLSDNLIGWDVIKTTTDKLSEMLNGWSEPWRVHTIQFMGGRDWVLIATCEFDSHEAKNEALA